MTSPQLGDCQGLTLDDRSIPFNDLRWSHNNGMFSLFVGPF